ncbi:hypothetical protein [Ensifer adhaerens]|uniref:hypothetical protein n=1 Tax=Ensifer adhaerens TaxID=106592 RepID=UPI001177680E|nr:hypothetical protein [Ensifer adhaerens]
MSEMIFGVIVIVAAVVAVLYWAAVNARREPNAKARKDDGSGYAGTFGDGSGDCGGGDGGGD